MTSPVVILSCRCRFSLLALSAFSLVTRLGMLEVDWEPEYLSPAPPAALRRSRLLCPLAASLAKLRDTGKELRHETDCLAADETWDKETLAIIFCILHSPIDKYKVQV